MEESDGLTYFTYEREVNGKNIKYFACTYKSEDAFWLVQFSCETDNFESLKEDIVAWAKSVKFASV